MGSIPTLPKLPVLSPGGNFHPLFLNGNPTPPIAPVGNPSDWPNGFLNGCTDPTDPNCASQSGPTYSYPNYPTIPGPTGPTGPGGPLPVTPVSTTTPVTTTSFFGTMASALFPWSRLAAFLLGLIAIIGAIYLFKPTQNVVASAGRKLRDAATVAAAAG
jgi:hypothetical protein